MGGGGVIVNLGGGRGHLREAPAKSLARIDKALGHRMQVTEALRSWLQQNAHWTHYLKYGAPIALHPDTPSIHQLGFAMDSDEAQKHIALMAEHGWIQTVYRWVNGKRKLIEPWHFEYAESRDQHRRETVVLVQTSSGAWHLPNPLAVPSKPAPAPIPLIVEEEEEDTMKIFGYKKPGDTRTTYVTMDFAGGLWNESVHDDAAYHVSIAEKWGDGAPLLSLGHRNELADRFDARWPGMRLLDA